jgi:uncharacterized membrane protein (UPF0136 family)
MMKEKSIVLFCYALLVLTGGIMGYFMANSLPSLIASGVSSLILVCCSVLIWKGSMKAHHIATFVVVGLFAFFTYRFFLTYKVVPAGMMLVISGCIAGYLTLRKESMNSQSFS